MKIPKEVQSVLEKLKKQGYEAYAVGGCVRDFLRGVEPKDWDVCTNARPEEMQKIFPQSFYENKFGTVTVKTQNSKLKTQNYKSKLKTFKKSKIDEIQITTYRLEAKYTDKRHPDEVKFTANLREDLARRDFTINAMALKSQKSKVKSQKYEIIDLFEGQKDLEQKIIRAVGQPDDRFNEDALRMLRAVRLAGELNFQIEPKTFQAIQKNAGWLQAIAKERIRDELIKIIISEKPEQTIELLKEAKLLNYIIPELEKGVGITQNRHHIYTIYQHSLLSLKYAAERGYNLVVRLAAFFHDIAKPQTKEGEGPDATFYNHDVLGARFASQILARLKFPKKTIERVASLVRHHMFVYDVERVSQAGVRRLLRRVGPENIQDMIDLRVADRLGSGCPKAMPYKLRHLQYVIEKVSQDPISVKMLKINGDGVMKILGIQPSPRVGLILNALLSEILDEPKKNTQQYLQKRTKELNRLSDEELKAKTKKVAEKKEEIDLEVKKKYWIK